jgi:hypothetical protein
MSASTARTRTRTASEERTEGMETKKFRIVEWTSEFRSGSREVTFELQAEKPGALKRWESLGTSSTLQAARKALLFHAPYTGCWPS